MGAPSSGIFSKNLFTMHRNLTNRTPHKKTHNHQLLLFKSPTFFLSSTLLTQTYNPFLQILTPYTLTYTLLQKLNTIYKHLSTENSPLQIPLSLTHPTIPFNINMLPLDTSIIYCAHASYIMKNIIMK